MSTDEKQKENDRFRYVREAAEAVKIIGPEVGSDASRIDTGGHLPIEGNR